MTWTKLGDEFGPEARDLTDAEFRTHVEALCWSSWRLLDLHVPKRDVPRFAESQDAGGAVEGLAVKGWWQDRGDVWYIGVRFAEWQLEREEIERKRADGRLRKRRQRAHEADDHSLCLPGRCPHVTRDGVRDGTRLSGSGRDGTTSLPTRPVGQDQDQTHPSPFPTPGNGNGPEEPLPPDERNLTNGVPLQSPATAPIAREPATEPPGPLAPESEIAAWQVGESRRQRQAAEAGSSPSCPCHTDLTGRTECASMLRPDGCPLATASVGAAP